MSKKLREFDPNKLVFNIFLIGLISSLRKNQISIDDANMLLFSPSGLDRVEDNQSINEFSTIIAKALELDDIYNIVGDDAYQTELKLLEEEIFEHLAYSKYEDMLKASRIITSLGSIESLEVKPKDNKVEIIATNNSNIFLEKLESEGPIKVSSIKFYADRDFPNDIEIVLFETDLLGTIYLKKVIDSSQLYWSKECPELDNKDQYHEMTSPLTTDRFTVYLYWSMFNSNFYKDHAFQLHIEFEKDSVTYSSYLQFEGLYAGIVCYQFDVQK